MRRNTTRDTPWSPKLHQAYVITQILKAVYQQKVRGKDRETRIKSFQEKLETPINVVFPSIEELIKELKTAKGTLDQIRRDADEYRRQFIIEQANIAEIEGKITKQKVLNQLIYMEKTRENI